MPDLKHYDGKIDLSDWEFSEDEDLNKFFIKRVGEALENSFEGCAPFAMLYEWSEDAMNISVSIPLGNSVDENVWYRVSIEDLFDGCWDDCGEEDALQMAERLRSLANKIEHETKKRYG
jgi:hypothetical protein